MREQKREFHWRDHKNWISYNLENLKKTVHRFQLLAADFLSGLLRAIGSGVLTIICEEYIPQFFSNFCFTKRASHLCDQNRAYNFWKRWDQMIIGILCAASKKSFFLTSLITVYVFISVRYKN